MTPARLSTLPRSFVKQGTACSRTSQIQCHRIWRARNGMLSFTSAGANSTRGMSQKPGWWPHDGHELWLLVRFAILVPRWHASPRQDPRLKGNWASLPVAGDDEAPAPSYPPASPLGHGGQMHGTSENTREPGSNQRYGSMTVWLG